MKIGLTQLRFLIREEVQHARRSKSLCETGSKGVGIGLHVPLSSDELRDMLADAAPPRALDIGDRISQSEMDRLWTNVQAEIEDGTPWEDIVDGYIYDWLITHGFDPADVDDIVNHLA